MILLIILIILIIFFLQRKDTLVEAGTGNPEEDTLLKNSNIPGPLNRIREGESGIVTKGSYNIPYVRIRTELHDMLGL